MSGMRIKARQGLAIIWGLWGVFISFKLFSPADGPPWQLCLHGWILVILVILPLFKSIVKSHLDYCVQAWRPHYRKDIDNRGVDSWLVTRLESRLESHFCDSWLDSSHGPLRLTTRLGLDPLTRTSHVESRSSHLAIGRSWSETVETESVQFENFCVK